MHMQCDRKHMSWAMMQHVLMMMHEQKKVRSLPLRSAHDVQPALSMSALPKLYR